MFYFPLVIKQVIIKYILILNFFKYNFKQQFKNRSN
jgi:hypothetical protein